MATGNPKTTWQNGEHQVAPARNAAPMRLMYEGKAPEATILATEPSTPIRLWEGVPAAPNRLYMGDNLPLLAHLLRDPRVKGQVKVIYIDPPFATKSVFHARSQADAYQDLLTGAAYIEFLRERLVLLRELLAEDGSIYIHLDENMIFHAKVIMDEVFGVNRYRNMITRRKCSHKNFTRKTYGNISDYILFYTKTDNYIWNRAMEPWTPDRAIKEYPCIDEQTGRRYKKVPVHAPGTRNGETGKPWRHLMPPPGKHWQYPPQVLDEMDARGEIYWSPTGNPRRKIFLDASEGVAIQDIWFDVRDDRNQNIHITGYPTEKNPDLLRRIIAASSNPGDLILDCFAGSGTTLAVAEELGRTWIGMDKSSEAINATLQRLVQGSKRMGDYVKRPEREDDNTPQATMFHFFEEQPVEEHTMPSNNKLNFSVYAEPSVYEATSALLNKIIQPLTE